MGIKQISVFLENTTGRLSEVTKTLANAGINLRAISIADTDEFGILRLIADKTDKAIEALNAANFTTKQTDVVAVEIDDSPGSLAKLMEIFQKSKVNIEYLYASLEGQIDKAVVIFKLKDHNLGLKILADNGLKMPENF
ncbi:MAG: ACT domain-containing protein [Treponema sp.]|nr:ACT domain-containing protein [Treponema sp.]MCL2252298.1 ACT domain-containing protein [Treponema sp.]